MTQTQQRSLISIVFITLIAGLIVSLNVDNQDAQSGVSVIAPLKNRQVGEKWVYDDCSYLCKSLTIFIDT
jgi:hypothetical protein